MIFWLAIAPVFLQPFEITVPPVEPQAPIESSVVAVDLPPMHFDLVSSVAGLELLPTEGLESARAELAVLIETGVDTSDLAGMTAQGISFRIAQIDGIINSRVSRFPADRWLEIQDVLPDVSGKITKHGHPVYAGSGYAARVRELGRLVNTEGFTDAVMEEGSRLKGLRETGSSE